MAKRACLTTSVPLVAEEAASPVEPVTYKLASAWAEEENQNFAMLETAKKLAEQSCPAACQIIQLVLDRMRDCVPEENLLRLLSPREAAHV